MIFVAVSWGRLGVGGRAAVMTAVTAVSALGARQAARRGLTATAEAVSLLTVALALLDCAGARASDLFGLRDVDGTLVAAGSVALVAAAAAAGSHALPTRALRLSGALLGQLAVPLLAVHLADASDHPAAVLAAGLTAQALGALALAALWPGSERSRDARLAVGAGRARRGHPGDGPGGRSRIRRGRVRRSSAPRCCWCSRRGPARPPRRSPDGSRLTSRSSAALRGVAAALVVAGVWAPVVDVAARTVGRRSAGRVRRGAARAGSGRAAGPARRAGRRPSRGHLPAA